MEHPHESIIADVTFSFPLFLSTLLSFFFRFMSLSISFLLFYMDRLAYLTIFAFFNNNTLFLFFADETILDILTNDPTN